MSTSVLIARPGYKKFAVSDLNLNIVGNPVYGGKSHRNQHTASRTDILVKIDKSRKPSIIITYDGNDYIMPLMNERGNVIQGNVTNYEKICRSSSRHRDESEIAEDIRDVVAKLRSGLTVALSPQNDDLSEVLTYISRYWSVVPAKTTTASVGIDDELSISKLMIFCVQV